MEDPDYNCMTPWQSFVTLYDLYERRDMQFYGLVIDWLIESSYHNRLDRDLPEGVVVAHKYGDDGVYGHDMGIFFGDKPYLLLVFTESIANSNDLIAQISLLIYEYMSR